ncbi:hypothetical protein [Kitasatospora kifunensis]|uniref:Uncharacterized protein n=1 Tax=Kitasatospora kifunensis TaxID=58351 RepID=A0A7W7RBV1_KITKI|nr:hypothetical protein [Kitasatospora kifunensis]MBB4929059.1 hypothetical protein [Kitasatospora kifunensis]
MSDDVTAPTPADVLRAQHEAEIQHEPVPDYADTSLAFAYLWIRHADGQDPAFGTRVLRDMAGELEAYAAARGARLVGRPGFDFPSPLNLPKNVQSGVRRAMYAQERRPWRWPRMVLVRIWQDTAPLPEMSGLKDRR